MIIKSVPMKKVIPILLLFILISNILYELSLNTIFNIHQISFDNMTYSEMILNYNFGIIRRGLVGELIYQINLILKFNSSIEIVNFLIFTVNIINLTLLSYLFLKDKKIKLFLLFIIAPGSLFLVYTQDFHLFARTDIFGYLFLLIQFATQTSKSKVLSSFKFQVIFLSISYLIIPFIHDGFVFLFFPSSLLLFYIYFKNNGFIKLIIPSVFLLLSYFLIILALLIYKVNPDALFNALTIQDKSVICNNCQGPIDSMDYGYYYFMKINTIKHSFVEIIYQIANFNIWYWLNILVVIYIFTYLTCEYSNLKLYQENILICFIIITIPILLLCIIAIDYGRYFGTITMNLFLFFNVPYDIFSSLELRLGQKEISINKILNIEIKNKILLIIILVILGLGTPVAYTSGFKQTLYKNNFILIIKDHIFPKKYFR